MQTLSPVAAVATPSIQIVEHHGILVVRDDFMPGGTKARMLPRLFNGHAEYVYASPVQGYAQVALAHCARMHGKRATVFCAARKARHPRTLEAVRAGVKLVEVGPAGYLSVVQKRARDYCAVSGAKLLPFGLDVPAIREGIAELAFGLGINPPEVWTVAGSGTLSRALQLAWPAARFYAVRIGAEPNAGRATVIQAPERFDDDAKEPPPFPSCGNYDAKAWRFIKRMATPGAVFWNVAG